jgi:hypothetical protein
VEGSDALGLIAEVGIAVARHRSHCGAAGSDWCDRIAGYLARQIRETQRALRAGSYQQFREDIHQAIDSALTVPGLAEIVSVGMASFDQLDDDDAFRFNRWINGVMHSYDNAYYQYRMGMLDVRTTNAGRCTVRTS